MWVVSVPRTHTEGTPPFFIPPSTTFGYTSGCSRCTACGEAFDCLLDCPKENYAVYHDIRKQPLIEAEWGIAGFCWAVTLIGATRLYDVQVPIKRVIVVADKPGASLPSKACKASVKPPVLTPFR